jgi:hypothetical protein
LDLADPEAPGGGVVRFTGVSVSRRSTIACGGASVAGLCIATKNARNVGVELKGVS